MNNLFKVFISFLMMLSGTRAFGAGVHPEPPTCQMQSDQVVDGVHTSVTNYTCQNAWTRYNEAMTYWNKAEENGSNKSYTGLTEPVKPVTPTCSDDDYGCKSTNQVADAAYNRQKDLYDRQKQIMDASAASAADAAKAKADADAMKSASGGYSNVAEKSKTGSILYQVAASAAGMEGVKYLGQAAGCSVPSCQVPLVIAAQVAFAIMGAGKSQANRMDVAAVSACQSANQTAALQTGCAAPPKADPGNVYDPTDPNNALSGLDKNGKCKSDAPPSCSQMLKDPRYAGTDFKSLGAGVSGFASGKFGAKISKDGIVTLPDGTKTTVEALMTREGMLKAGMSPAQIDSLMKQIGANPALVDAKKDLKDLNKAGLPISDTGGLITGGATGDGTARTLNGNATGLKDINKRKPSSEGLTRNFNGESIGAQGEDIFSMMNRRYKLKSSQDSFMGPK